MVIYRLSRLVFYRAFLWIFFLLSSALLSPLYGEESDSLSQEYRQQLENEQQRNARLRQYPTAPESGTFGYQYQDDDWLPRQQQHNPTVIAESIINDSRLGIHREDKHKPMITMAIT